MSGPAGYFFGVLSVLLVLAFVAPAYSQQAAKPAGTPAEQKAQVNDDWKRCLRGAWVRPELPGCYPVYRHIINTANAAEKGRGNAQ